MLIASAVAVNCGIFFAIAALHGKGDNYLVGYKIPPANLTSEEQNSTRSEEKYIQTIEQDKPSKWLLISSIFHIFL